MQLKTNQFQCDKTDGQIHARTADHEGVNLGRLAIGGFVLLGVALFVGALIWYSCRQVFSAGASQHASSRRAISSISG